jgi:plasmid stabilization system protein ParE
MAEYIISEKAIDDLNNIWIYTAEIGQLNKRIDIII